ncbi:MAG: long-chain fatty acid--CoA ligase [Bacteroidales bacterium]|nr:long-chain fatty acid--CoA ligase [Bacteroidales bacterium]
MEITRIFDFLDNACEKFPRKDCLVSKVDGQWKMISTEEYRQTATYLAYGLMALGIKKGDKIASVSNNRPEWNYIDMAIAMCGACHVPVYPTISSKDYDFILNHSEVKMAFISDVTAYNRVAAVKDNIKTMEKIFSFNEIEGVENWKAVLNLGISKADEYKEKLEAVKASVTPDDLCSIIYTSGTTGISKGAMLTHNNFVSNATASCEILGLDHNDKILSVLPLCHVYERCFIYMYQYLGIGIYYAQNLGTIVSNFKEVGANGCNTVPRVAEKIVEGIMKEGAKLTGHDKELFDEAVALGREWEHEGKSPEYYERIKQLDPVYKHWRDDFFGGNMKFFGCGGAAISPNLSRMLWAAGIKVCEGYGLTETSPVIAHASVKHHKFTSVGPVISNEHVKIDEDGEILVKGPNVMAGYYKNPEATAEVMTEDGYFRTGDIGYLSEGNYLHITDRKKEIFKTSSGKYIAPAMIEGKVKESPYISQLCIVGENQKFASAIISPDFDALKIWLQNNGTDSSAMTNEDVITNADVQKLIDEEIQKVNKTIGKVEQIAKHHLVADVWGSDTGELTQTQKLKRKVVAAKYKAIIDAIYTK